MTDEEFEELKRRCDEAAKRHNVLVYIRLRREISAELSRRFAIATS